MLLAHLLHPPVVAFGSDQHAAGAHDRLGEEARDVVRPELRDRAFEIRNQVVAIGRLVADAIRHPIAVGVRDMMDQALGKLETRLVSGLAGQRRGQKRAAVIGVSPRDDQPLRRLADGVEIVVGDPHGGVVGGGAAGAVEGVIEVSRSQLGEFGGQLRCRRIRQVGEVGVLRQGAELPRCRIDQLLAAVAHVGEPQAADAIDEPVPAGVPHVRSVAADHGSRSRSGPVGKVGPGMDAVLQVRPVKVCRVTISASMAASHHAKRRCVLP